MGNNTLVQHKVELNANKKSINRDTVDLNEVVLGPVVEQLGLRVGIELLSFHIEAFFQMLELPLSSFQVDLCIIFFLLGELMIHD